MSEDLVSKSTKFGDKINQFEFTDEHVGTIEWSIDNFTKEAIENFPYKEKVESPIFSIPVGDEMIKWVIYLYPNGYDENENNYISIFHKNVNFNQLISKSGLQVLFSIGFRRQCDAKDYMKTDDWLELENFRLGRGFFMFMSHEKLFDPVNAFITDSKLTLFSQIKIVKSSKSLKDSQAPLMATTCLSYYKKFFNDELYADFELETSDGKTLKAHKSILAARTPVFYAMLKPQTKEAEENHVDILDFDSAIMKEVLRFIYYFEVEKLDAIAADLIHAAEKYELTELKEMCIESLVSTMSAENVIDSLIISNLISGTEKLFEKSIRTLIRHYHQIKQSDEWNNLCTNLKMKVLQEMADQLTPLPIKFSSSIP